MHRQDISSYARWRMRAQVLAEIYVCCFTSLPDDISQWRAYGAYGSPSSARYCIGFDAQSIRRFAAKLPDTVFDRVIYEETRQLDRVTSILKQAMAFADQEDVYPAEIEPLSEVLASHLVRLICVLKSPAYHVKKSGGSSP